MISPEDEQLIKELATASIAMGMTPIEARIQGLLTISPEPLTLDQIGDLLKVSKSSVSVATRELERHGAALRFTESGTKRVRYGIAERSTGFLSAQVEFLGTIGNLLCRRAAASPRSATTARLQDMGTFYLHIRDALITALSEN